MAFRAFLRRLSKLHDRRVKNLPTVSILAFVIFLPAVSAAVFVYLKTRDDLTATALAERQAVASLAAGTLKEKLHRLVDVSVSLASRVRFRQLVAERKWDDAIEIMRNVPKEFPFIERVFIADTKGTLMSDVPALPGVRGVNFAYRDWYRGVGKEWQPYISEAYQRHAEPRYNVISIAVPITLGDRKAVGVLVVQIKVESMLKWSETVGGGPLGFVFAVDQRGQAIGHSKSPHGATLIDYSKTLPGERIRRGQKGVDVIFDEARNRGLVLAYQPVPSYGWGVIVEQPASETFAARDNNLKQLLLGYLVIGIFSGLLTYVIARFTAERRQAKEEIRTLSQELTAKSEDVDKRRRATVGLTALYNELQTLYEINREIFHSRDLKQILESILDKTLAVGSFDLGVIRLFDPESGTLNVAASRGYRNPENISLHQQKTTDPETGRLNLRVLTAKEPIVEEDVQTRKGLRTFKKEGIQSAVVIPIRANEEIFGVIQLGSRARRKFEGEEIRLYEAIGSQIGIAIQKARLYEETMRNLERIRALHEIDRAISSTLDLRSVLNILLEKLGTFLPYAAAGIWLVTEEQRQLEPVACRNIDQAEWKNDMRKAGAGLIEAVIQANGPLTVRNVQSDPRTFFPDLYRKHALVSFIGTPMFSKHEIVGVLGFYTKEEHKFSVQEIEFLKTLAGQAAIAIENAKLYEATKKQAVDLERANKVKDEFLNLISHELRTPLTVIRGYTALIDEGMYGAINHEVKNALLTVSSRTNDLLNLVNNILEATKIETEEVMPILQDVDVREFLSCLKAMHRPPRDKPVFLHWDYPASLTVVRTDPHMLSRILLNLINNAMKFTSEGSVTVSARFIEATRSLEFSVIDTGIGIPEESRELVFEKFTQVDTSSTRPYEGIGLGLYIAKKLAGFLGGALDFESEVGKGSRFMLSLPAEPARNLYAAENEGQYRAL